MTDIEDVQGFAQALGDELDRLGQFHPDDRPLVERWVQKVDGQTADSSLALYLANLRTTADLIDGPLCDLSERDLDEATYHMRREQDLSDGTVRNKQFAVRKFLADLDLCEWAEDYDLVEPPDNTVSPEDMLGPEDINALTSAAGNLRDVALIEFLADTGARISLVASLRVRDVDLQGETATFTPNPDARGLKNAPIRDYPIIDSQAVLRTYLQQVHPRPDADDVAFFHVVPGHGNDMDGDGAMTPTAIRQRLRQAAAEADLDKPVNPHNFRHSAVTRMVREGYSRSQIEHRVAWTIDTDMWETYTHVTGEEHNRDIFREAGVLDADEDDVTAERRPCGNCQEPLAPHHLQCPKCGHVVDAQLRQALDAADDDLVADAIDEPVASDRDLIGVIREVVREEVDALDDVDHD